MPTVLLNAVTLASSVGSLSGGISSDDPPSYDMVLFPTDISYGSRGGPGFKTEVVEMAGGQEKRNQEWEYPRAQWDVAYGIKSEALLFTLYEFFMVRRGMARSFMFKDHRDWRATTEQYQTDGDGSTQAFQLFKNYTSGGRNLKRKIVRPIVDTVAMFLGGTPTSAFTVDETTGIVTFTSPPSSGTPITATFDFYLHMRFDTDYMPIEFSTYEAEAATVPLMELR